MAGGQAVAGRAAGLPLALGGLIALAAAMGIGRFVYTPILPYMLDAGTLDPASGGLVASANFIGYVIGAIGAALVTPPGSRRAWFLGALAASALSTLAMGMTGHVAFQALIRFAGGVSSALVMVYASTLILERLALSGRGGLSAVHFAGVGSGIALSALIVPAVSALGGGWPSMWAASGLFALAGLGAAFALVPADPPRPGAEPPPLRGRMTGPLARLILAYGLFGFGYVITATFISAMARGDAALRPYEAWFWLAVGLAAIPSVAFWTWLGRRASLRASFALACLAEAAGVAMSVLGADPLPVMAGAVLLGGTFMGLTALGLIFAREIAPGDPRVALAWMTAAFGLGQMIGPALAGVVFEATGSFTGSSLTAALALILAAVLVLTVRQSPK